MSSCSGGRMPPVKKRSDPMPRKSKPVDEKVVEGMASVGATDTEIADFVGLDKSNVGRRFATILTKARSGMRTRLRQAQFKAALTGNATMLIWLGKQMLDQVDKSEHDVNLGSKTLDAILEEMHVRHASK